MLAGNLPNLLLLSVFMLGQGEADPAISIKYVDKYTQIWNDQGSGADKDVSIWQPFDAQTGVYALGDVAVDGYSKPTSSAVMVREFESGALREPVSLKLIWTDSGSGASLDVSIYEMIPASGYTCLGSIATGSYRTPSTSYYRCVKSGYLTAGLLELVWNDRGSGAGSDVSLWRVFKTQTYAGGIAANTFLAHSGYTKPSTTPWVLKSVYTIDEKLLPPLDTAVINLYPAPETKLVWNDQGSGADADFSCWRPDTFEKSYRMGDVPRNSYSQPPGGYVAKPRQSGIITNPISYDKIWTDSGSGASMDGSFWRPRCPSGYRYISFACSGSHGSPPLDAVSCVKAEHTVSGRWEQIWTDRGSGADDDVAIYMARRKNADGQEVNGLGARKNQGYLPPAYVLKSSSVRYVDSKPVKKYEITSVSYELDRKSILDSKLEDLKVTHSENTSPDCQKTTTAVAVTVEESHTWSVGASIEVGAAIEVEAGLPLIASSTVTVSTTVSSSFGTEDSKTTSKEISDSVEAAVRPCNTLPVTLTGRRYTTDVPYTAKMKITYTDDTTADISIKGTYRGVTVSEATAHVGNPVRIGGCNYPSTPCGGD